MTDPIAIYDSSGRRLFKSAHPMKAAVRSIAKIAEHPLESGATRADHRIFLPIEIDVSLILEPSEYQAAYQEIEQAYYSDSPLSITLRTRAYDSLCISALPHEETPELADTVSVQLKLRQFQVFTAQYTTVASPKRAKHKSTVKTGQKAPAAAPSTPQGSALYQQIFGSK